MQKVVWIFIMNSRPLKITPWCWKYVKDSWWSYYSDHDNSIKPISCPLCKIHLNIPLLNITYFDIVGSDVIKYNPITCPKCDIKVKLIFHETP